jgi:uridine kinase
MDSFYKSLTPEENMNVSEYNFDHPDAIDFDEIRATIDKLMAREVAEIPIYDFSLNARTNQT